MLERSGLRCLAWVSEPLCFLFSISKPPELFLFFQKQRTLSKATVMVLLETQNFAKLVWYRCPSVCTCGTWAQGQWHPLKALQCPEGGECHMDRALLYSICYHMWMGTPEGETKNTSRFLVHVLGSEPQLLLFIANNSNLWQISKVGIIVTCNLQRKGHVIWLRFYH